MCETIKMFQIYLLLQEVGPVFGCFLLKALQMLYVKYYCIDNEYGQKTRTKSIFLKASFWNLKTSFSDQSRQNYDVSVSMHVFHAVHF